jgi:hypothetical protein
MSIFSRFFSKEPTPEERVSQWITAMRADILSTAEIRLGRTLRPDEKSGVEHIQSMMMLESLQREVAFEKSTPEQIERSLAHFAAEATAPK